MAFCSGLGGVAIFELSLAVLVLSSCCDGLPLAPEAVPGRTVSIAATELRLLFTLAPEDGEEGLGAATAPFSVGICEPLPDAAPSEERMSRVAAGCVLLELDPGLDLSFLKKKLMSSWGTEESEYYR